MTLGSEHLSFRSCSSSTFAKNSKSSTSAVDPRSIDFHSEFNFETFGPL